MPADCSRCSANDFVSRAACSAASAFSIFCWSAWISSSRRSVLPFSRLRCCSTSRFRFSALRFWLRASLARRSASRFAADHCWRSAVALRTCWDLASRAAASSCCWLRFRLASSSWTFSCTAFSVGGCASAISFWAFLMALVIALAVSCISLSSEVSPSSLAASLTASRKASRASCRFSCAFGTLPCSFESADSAFSTSALSKASVRAARFSSCSAVRCFCSLMVGSAFSRSRFNFCSCDAAFSSSRCADSAACWAISESSCRIGSLVCSSRSSCSINSSGVLWADSAIRSASSKRWSISFCICRAASAWRRSSRDCSRSSPLSAASK